MAAAPKSGKPKGQVAKKPLLMGVILLAVLVMTGIAGWRFLRGAGQLAQGQKLYAENCASCHGAKLEGEPNWMERKPDGRLPAPPHDASGHTWHHADPQLFGIVKNGVTPYAGPGYQSDMPAFKGILSDDEILAVLAYIKQTWPRDIQNQQRQISEQNQDRR
jgi:mono/diheme cytochrome c family protein